jgi:hypothetical protein
VTIADPHSVALHVHSQHHHSLKAKRAERLREGAVKIVAAEVQGQAASWQNAAVTPVRGPNERQHVSPSSRCF